MAFSTCIAAFSWACWAQGQMVLTPAAAAANWKLSTYAENFAAGPIGIAFADSGSVLVSCPLDGTVRLFSGATDTVPPRDASTAFVATKYPPTQDKILGLIRIGSSIYLDRTYVPGSGVNVGGDTGNAVDELSQSGAVIKNVWNNPLKTTGQYNPCCYGMAANDGNLFVAMRYNGGSGLYEYNLTTGANNFNYYAGLYVIDGICAGRGVVYGEVNGSILGFRWTGGTTGYDSGYMLNADGCAYGSMFGPSGSLFVNTNDGQVFQIDLKTQVITLLATGGSRGDFVQIAPNGSLLLTQSAKILRLTPPPATSFLPSTVSCPSTTKGGGSVVGTITLPVPAPATIKVALSSSSAIATVPKSVTIPAGYSTATFTIATTKVETASTETITSVLNGVSSTAKLAVTP